MPFFDDNLFEHMAPRASAPFTFLVAADNPFGPEPLELDLVFAGRPSPYWNELQKQKKEDDFDKATRRAAALFGRYAVTGWRGCSVPWSPDAASELLLRMAQKDRWDKVNEAIGFAVDEDNFKAPLVRATDLGKR